MGIVVQKYGGSSVADVDRLGKVADRVVAESRRGQKVVVVVSAMGKTTDQLLALARQVDESPPRRELDMLLTTGERVTMALLSMAIQKRGFDAISFTGSQSGIITNDRHFDARIIEVRPHRVEDELARDRIVIIAGYQGMSYKREITTLGRGGSDTTALAMAAALGAERAEIYSDVDGVYTADPRAVEGAQHLPEITYDEMQEMAEAGAKVLHAGAVEFAKRARITIHARASFPDGSTPTASARETLVHDEAVDARGTRAVVGRRAVVRVSVTGGQVALRRALKVVERYGVVPPNSFTVATEHAPGWAEARDDLTTTLKKVVRIQDGLGAVSIVGSSFGRDPEAALRVLDVLEEDGTAALHARLGPLRMTVLVAEADLSRSVRSLHARLLGDPAAVPEMAG